MCSLFAIACRMLQLRRGMHMLGAKLWLCITALQAIPKNGSVNMASPAFMLYVTQAVIPGLQVLIPMAVACMLAVANRCLCHYCDHS